MNEREPKNKSRRSFFGKTLALIVAGTFTGTLAEKIFSSKSRYQAPIHNRPSTIANPPHPHPLSVKRAK
jgi:hypothetical protein